MVPSIVAVLAAVSLLPGWAADAVFPTPSPIR